MKKIMCGPISLFMRSRFAGRAARQIRREWLPDVGDPQRDGHQLLLAALGRDGQHRARRPVLRGVCQALQLPQGER